MAIDGTAIIDSDDAHDVYNAIVERYKNGENIEQIRQEILAEAENFSTNELYAEIYWTALAFSLWKIGHLTDDVKQKALQIIRGGASKIWTEYIDEKAQKSRQKHLEKLATQLQSENPKPIKPYKPVKKSRKPHFEVGDVLAVKLEQGYGACFVFSIDQTPRKIEYHLICTRLLQNDTPTFEQVMSSKIASGLDESLIDPNSFDYMMFNDETIDVGKDPTAIRTDCWFNHKDLGEILPAFTKLGKVEFEPDCKLWLMSPAHSLDDIYEQITRKTEFDKFALNDVRLIVKNIIED